MATGASGRTIPSSKAFDFASDDVLCAYDEFSQESADGVVSDPAAGKDFSKDFQKSRMTRTFSPSAVYNQPDQSAYQETFSMVEKCMKRHTDDLMRFLEGISSRLSQLELYCYNIDKSVGEMRSNMGRDYEETGSKLKSIEKHLGEVSRSVQILRDKQELAETQKTLAKLQLAQKELSSPSARQRYVERSPSPTSDTSEVPNQHLAIVLRSQVAPQPQSPPKRPVEVPQPFAPSSQIAPQPPTQPQRYYLTSAQLQVQVQPSQGQYYSSDTQYQTPQPVQQDSNLVRLQQVPAQVSQAPPQVHQFIQYQQRPQQPQQMAPSVQLSAIQQPPTPALSRPQSASGYPPQQPGQTVPQGPQEAVSSSIHMHTSFPGMPQQAVTRADVMPNGYVQRPVHQQPPPQYVKANFGAPSGDVYTSMGQHQSVPPATAYMTYGNGELRRQPQHPSQFSQVSYPPANAPLQHPQPPHASVIRNPSQPQFTRNHPYNDLIDKFVNMGYRADHVLSVIQRMEESGQAVDFNAVLDKLNVQSAGFHRGWTG
uniref:DUF1421 domain-containing protein n=1 Tax=Kalanchoe fedtschenkoi TaxID=63787 RepID=A0A7N0T8S9_KALFE